MTWLTAAGNSLGNIFQYDKKNMTRVTAAVAKTPTTLGILCFETAKMMSRLLSLYQSLSDADIQRLRFEVMRSQGVAYLNSGDEDHLLHLACAELIEELDHIAASVTRLGAKCSDTARGLLRFDLLYAELKLGLIDPKKIEFGSRSVQRIVEKMEKLVSETGNLYSVWESLEELEHSERKINRWKKNADPKQIGKITNLECFQRKIAFLRKQVQRYKKASLWTQTSDNSVGFMARIVCVVYARIYVVFGPDYYVPGVQCSPTEHCLLEERDIHLRGMKRARKTSPMGLGRFRRRNLNDCNDFYRITRGEIGKNEGVSRLTPQSTVGGSALTVRYANVIILAERCLYAPETVNEHTREELYEMLPESLRRTVRVKLKKRFVDEEYDDKGERDGYALAEGWRDALEEMMTWLAPMAHDTLTWQAERNLERPQRYFDYSGKPSPSSSVLLLQTLHFSDLEKTEAAIAEVLVGLSCVFRYENRRCPGNSHHHHRTRLREPVEAGYEQ